MFAPYTTTLIHQADLTTPLPTDKIRSYVQLIANVYHGHFRYNVLWKSLLRNWLALEKDLK